MAWPPSRVAAPGYGSAASRVPCRASTPAVPPAYPTPPRSYAQRLRVCAPYPAPAPCRGLAVLYCDIVWPCLTIQLAQLPNSLITIHLSVLRYKSLLPAFSHNTVQCIAIHSSVLLGASVTIQSVYCNTLPAHPSCLSCNTIFIIAIQLGSSPNQVLHQKYFLLFFFIIIFFSSYFQQLEKSLKIFFFFIFLNTQINL